MNIDFSDQDLLCIYGHFQKRIKKIEALQSIPNCPVDKKSINQEFKLCSSIVDKIKVAYPNLAKLDSTP